MTRTHSDILLVQKFPRVIGHFAWAAVRAFAYMVADSLISPALKQGITGNVPQTILAY